MALVGHDREQIELRLEHPLPGSSGRAEVLVDMFVFIPRNVGITAANYPREEFYGDLTALVRVDLPDLDIEQLANFHDPRSPLAALHAQLAAIGRGRGGQQTVTTQVKLFGHGFTEALRQRTDGLIDRLRALPARANGERWHYLDDVDRFAGTARDALTALRRARRACEPLSTSLPAAVGVFHYTDEYCSLAFDAALARIAEEARRIPALFDGTGFVGRLRQTLARHADPEARYREEHGYLNAGHGEGRAGEYFSYRQSLLKKAVQQALYVDTRLLPTDKFVRNATGAVAAGLAATWAVATQLPAQLDALSASTQLMLLALPVVAYIGKDRIKELTREWLTRRLRAFDHDTAIQAGALTDAGLGTLAGRVQERVCFKRPGEVPREVIATRAAIRTVHVGDGESIAESVLVYSRKVELHADPKAPPAPGLGLREILRLNLRHFLSRLDEPEQRENHFLLAEGRFASLALPKVYHLNVVVRTAAPQSAAVLRRWRVVLNKNGIVRLESVA